MITPEKLREISSQENFSYIVISLIKNKEISNTFLKEIESKFPEISNEILSSSVVENCSCDKKIDAHVLLNTDKWVDFLIDYNNIENISNHIFKIYERIQEEEAIRAQRQEEEASKIDLNGKIAKTTISDWKSFSQKITKNCYFKSFSVVKEGDEILVFFM
jgi:hypothetical protein